MCNWTSMGKLTRYLIFCLFRRKYVKWGSLRCTYEYIVAEQQRGNLNKFLFDFHIFNLLILISRIALYRKDRLRRTKRRKKEKDLEHHRFWRKIRIRKYVKHRGKTAIINCKCNDFCLRLVPILFEIFQFPISRF